MIFLTLLTIIAIFLLKCEIKRRKLLWFLRKYKSPKGLPFIGVTFDFADPKDGLLNTVKYYKECGNNFYSCAGPIITFSATEPNLAQCILGSPKLIEKSGEYKLLKSWFGNGLLTSKGDTWKNHRKIVTPSFHYKMLQEFVEIFERKSKKMVTKLKNEIGNDSFDIFNYATLFALDVVCETALGTVINAQDNPNSEYVISIKNMSTCFHNRVFSPLLRFDLFYYFSKTYQIEKKALKVIHRHTNSIIKERRKTLLNQSNEVNEFNVKVKHAFLDTLLQSTINGVPLTDKEIREEVDTVMFAGHDTTSVSISFTLYLLSKYLDVQDKVYEEIQLLLGNDFDKPITYDILQQMKYLEMVIKESLRIYPSAPILIRKLSEDTLFDGNILPKNLNVAIVAYLIHRNPEYYPDPLKFDPERFSYENSKNRHPFAYIPFSAGPRNCIGQKFAMLEMKTLISKILMRYKLMPAIPYHSVWPMFKITLSSANGIMIRLEERK